MKWKRLKIFLIEFSIFVLQMLISRIEIAGLANPAGYSFAVARVFYGHNIFLVALEYALSKIWTFKVFQNLLIVAFEIVILAVYYFSIEFIKTKRQRTMMLCYVALSNAVALYFSVVSLELVLWFCLSFVLELILSLYFFKLFQVYKNKFLFFKFSNLDYFVFAVLVLLISLGMFSFRFIEAYAGLFLVSLLLMVAIRIFPVEKFFVFACMLSVGAVIVSQNYFYLIFAIITSVSLVNFKDLNKYLFSVIALVVFGGFVVFYKFFVFLEYFSFIFAVFCFVMLPQRWICRFQILFEQDSSQMILSQVQDNKFGELRSKLELMSQTFLKMKNNFKMLLVGKIDRDAACRELRNDIIDKCCKDCENYKFCFLQNLNKKQMIENMLARAIEQNGLMEESMLVGLQTYCTKKSMLLSEINQLARLYLSYEKSMKREDESKLLISSELGNVADIFLNFAKIVKNDAKINKNMSKILKEHILNALIDVKETLIFENETGIKSVYVISENQNLIRRELLEIVQKVTKNKMKLKQVRHLEFSGLGVAVFEPLGKFRLEIAVSSKAKELKNGDNVVVSKLSETKYFVALADGMGHGESAGRISSMVLSLVRSMFEIGIDDELIVQSVNKLLVPIGLDNFSTLDACVIDIENEVCNFIKLGASVSVLKHRNTSEIIASASLPIGVVQNIKPTITKKRLMFDDVIFLASDGIVDSFSSPEEFKAFINDTKIYNLQQHLDNIVFDAGYHSQHLDDMTIIGVKLLKN